MGSLKNKRNVIIVISFLLILTAQFYVNKVNGKYLTAEEKQWLKNQDAIIYAANENAPPLRFVDELDNQYKGVVVDFVNQMSLELGIDIQTVPMQWDDALNSLKEGRTHLCDMFINKERSQHYLFTDSIYNLRTVLLTNTIENFEKRKINNMKIATELGDYANNYLKENYPGAELIYTHNVEEGLELFINGKADAVIGDEPLITYLLLERNENLNPAYTNIILYQQEVVFGVAKNKPELVPILNKVIAQIKEKGQLEKIQQKWFGISTPLTDDGNKAEIFKNIIIVSVLAGGIFVFIILNNLSLQRLVKIRTRELETNRNELQIIFDGIPDFMLAVGNDKRVQKINKRFADYLKVSSNDVIGEGCSNYIEKFCHGCDNCLINEANLSEKKINKEVKAGYDVYEMSFQPLKDTYNTVLISIKNITMDKINRNKILQTNKMIAVGQLAAGMAHQIRNPLGIIRMQSYLIRINENIDNGIIKSLDFIDTAVNRSSKIIENILSFSRLSSNVENSIDINQMIDRIIEMHNDSFTKNRITVKIESNLKEQLRLNEESLEHIIINLISNSIDAMNSGGNLIIKTCVIDDLLTLICEDNGCGIDEKDINDIFNPFFTTKEFGKGTGLGLFIVYSEVEKLNGKIDVKSQLNEGTTFIITIPLQGRIKQ